MTKSFVRQLFTGKVKQLGEVNATHPMDKPWESGMFKTETNDLFGRAKPDVLGMKLLIKKSWRTGKSHFWLSHQAQGSEKTHNPNVLQPLI